MHMTTYEEPLARIEARPRSWLVTGAAGFIGSHLVEALLRRGQSVVGLDNFATGFRHNLEQVRAAVGEAAWKRMRFIEGDIRSLDTCREACRSVELVLHQAALGSVPRSMDDPIASHESNVNGFLNMLVAARDAGVERLVYASSSATYGDHAALPKTEEVTGRALSPYGLTKQINELYAAVFASCYGLDSIGLRYFNVYGPRQNPHGAYASVIPAFIRALVTGEQAWINGDGTAARDFCYIDNAVQANLLAATTASREALNQAYNIAVGEQTTVASVFELLRRIAGRRHPAALGARAAHREARRGDVPFSRADVSKAARLLGYRPQFRLEQGLERTVQWYLQSLQPQAQQERKAAYA
jgi:UDP-N-acetylglucosamine/UDP-N-acetylgalactosamine 4-epimerase